MPSLFLISKVKKLLTLVIGLLCCALLRAQQVSNQSFVLNGDTLTITYDLDRTADICVRVALDGGPFTAPLEGLIGDVGKGIKPGVGLTITAVRLKEIRGVDSASLQFLVEVDDGSVMIYVGKEMFRMMPVEGGSFTMGCTRPRGEKHTYADELPTHKVTLPNYYIGQTEVTQALWVAVMGENPSKWIGDSLPVEQISWNDAQIFIARLSQLTQLHFRMPTEAEWEYAARGGNRSKHTPYPGVQSQIWETCWYGGNSNGHSHPVAQLRPNELGLFDMGGNVLEWCSDWMESYTDQPQTNPQGPRTGENRIMRGGCFNSPTWGCSVFERNWYLPDYGYSYFGLRLVLDTIDRDEE